MKSRAKPKAAAKAAKKKKVHYSEEESEPDEPSAKVYEDQESENDELVYEKGTFIAYQDHNDLGYSIAEIIENMNVKDEEAKIEIFELLDEKKLIFRKLDPKSRLGAVKHPRIITKLDVKPDKKKDHVTLDKKVKNQILKLNKNMPPMSESEPEEE